MQKSFLIVLFAASCRAPGVKPLDDEAVAGSIETREQVDRIREALELVELPPLLVDVKGRSEIDAIDGGATFVRLALAYEPGVRAARREFLAAQARLGSAGFPGRINAEGRESDLGNSGEDVAISASVDILGLLAPWGVGPAAAAEALADAEVRLAYAAFEQAAWEARFRADEARLAFATELSLHEQLTAHLDGTSTTLHRLEALDRRGRLPAAAVARVRAFVHLLGQQIADSRVRIEVHRAELARTCGLSVHSKLLDCVTGRTIEILEGEPIPPSEVDGPDLVRSHPELRPLVVEYAVREARLRAAVMAGWPSIRVGPRLEFNPGDLLTGGTLQIETPWPGSVRGEIDAAVQERSWAREAIEDALIDVLARRRASLERFRTASSSLRLEALPALERSRETWRGLQARFQVDESSWDLWTDALMLRTRAIVGYWRTRESEVLARIALARDSVMLEVQP